MMASVSFDKPPKYVGAGKGAAWVSVSVSDPQISSKLSEGQEESSRADTWLNDDTLRYYLMSVTNEARLWYRCYVERIFER